MNNAPPAGQSTDVRRHETIFDRVVHLEPELIKDIPAVLRLCDQLDGRKHWVHVGDATLYVEEEGEGIPLVLLHGGPGATHHYFHPDFSRAAAFAHVIYYDQRGCGQSEYTQDTGYTVEQAARDLEALRQHLQLPAWIVLGHSYGGFLAQYYTVRYPDSVRGLILVDSRIASATELQPSREHDFLSEAEIERIRSIYNRSDAVFVEETSTPGELSLAQKLYNAFLNGDWKRQNYYKPSAERIAQTALYEWKHDANFNSVINQDAAAINLAGAFIGCPIPTLLLEGRWDLCWNTDKPERLQEDHREARLKMFDQSGHFPFQDEPEQFFSTLREFISQLAAISPSEMAIWKTRLAQLQLDK